VLYPLLLALGVLAWFLSTIAAGGAATLLIPILGFLLGAQAVAPVLAVACLCANPSRVWLFRRDLDGKVCRWLLSGSLVGAFAGAFALTRISPDWVNSVIGLFLVSYVLQYRFGSSRQRFRLPAAGFLPVGFGTAFVSGLVGATGPVLNPFLLNYGLRNHALVATKALNYLVMQFTKITTYSLFGALNLELFGYGLFLGIGSVGGVILARRHLHRISTDRFTIYTLGLIAAAGGIMLYRGLTALL